MNTLFLSPQNPGADFSPGSWDREKSSLPVKVMASCLVFLFLRRDDCSSRKNQLEVYPVCSLPSYYNTSLAESGKGHTLGSFEKHTKLRTAKPWVCLIVSGVSSNRPFKNLFTEGVLCPERRGVALAMHQVKGVDILREGR